MLAASDDDSAMQHVQAAASETSKTSETSVPAVRPLRSALLADPAALMCRPFPPLQSWGCIPCPPQEENRCHCPPKDSCREIPDCPPPSCEPPHCRRPGPEICISRPCGCDSRPQPCKCPPCPPPEPCREDCCSPSGNSDLRRIIDLLCQILDNRRC